MQPDQVKYPDGTREAGRDILRMVRSVHWVGEIAGLSAALVTVVGVGLAVYHLWLPAAIAVGLVPILLLAWLPLFRRAEDQGKVEAEEERVATNWVWLREAGRLKRVGVIAVLVGALLISVLLNYLRWHWKLPPYGS